MTEICIRMFLPPCASLYFSISMWAPLRSLMADPPLAILNGTDTSVLLLYARHLLQAVDRICELKASCLVPHAYEICPKISQTPRIFDMSLIIFTASLMFSMSLSLMMQFSANSQLEETLAEAERRNADIMFA